MRIETQIPSPLLGCKRRQNCKARTIERWKNESNYGRVRGYIESQVSVRNKNGESFDHAQDWLWDTRMFWLKPHISRK